MTFGRALIPLSSLPALLASASSAMSDAEDVLCIADPSEAVLSALVTLLLLGLAIACFIGGWLAPELVALLAAGLAHGHRGAHAQ